MPGRGGRAGAGEEGGDPVRGLRKEGVLGVGGAGEGQPRSRCQPGRRSPRSRCHPRRGGPQSQGHPGRRSPQVPGSPGRRSPWSQGQYPLFLRAPGLAVPRWVRPFARRCRVAMMAGWLWPGRRRPSAAVCIRGPPGCHPHACQADGEGYWSCLSTVPSAPLLPESIWRSNGGEPPWTVVISSPCYSFSRYLCLISRC